MFGSMQQTKKQLCKLKHEKQENGNLNLKSNTDIALQEHLKKDKQRQCF